MLTPHTIALFLHIVGALGMFASFSLEWASLAFLRRSSTAEQAREWLGIRSWVIRLGPASLLLILLSGLYMMAPAWIWMGWIVAALAAMVLIAIIGATLTGLRMGRIEQVVATASGPLSPIARQQLADPVPWTSVAIRTAIALGIVFIMVAKPDLTISLITIGITVALGLVLALPMWRRARVKGEQAPSRA